MWPGGQPPAGAADAAPWNVNAPVFEPGGGQPQPPRAPPGAPVGVGMPPQRPPAGPPLMAMGPPMQPFPGHPGQWQPGMPHPGMAPGMPGMGMPGMPGPGWPPHGPRGHMPPSAEAWHQAAQNAPPMQGSGPPEGYGAQMPGANMGIPGQAEQQAAARPVKPTWVAIWNVFPESEDQHLRHELDQIDFLPETHVKVKELEGAFLLGYRDYPFLADALCVALDKTTEHVKGNGEPLRVAKCSNSEDLPPEVLRAFENLGTQEVAAGGSFFRQNI